MKSVLLGSRVAINTSFIFPVAWTILANPFSPRLVIFVTESRFPVVRKEIQEGSWIYFFNPVCFAVFWLRTWTMNVQRYCWKVLTGCFSFLGFETFASFLIFICLFNVLVLLSLLCGLLNVFIFTWVCRVPSSIFLKFWLSGHELLEKAFLPFYLLKDKQL